MLKLPPICPPKPIICPPEKPVVCKPEKPDFCPPKKDECDSNERPKKDYEKDYGWKGKDKDKFDKDHGWKGKDKDKCEKEEKDKCDKDYGWKGKDKYDKCDDKKPDCKDYGKGGKDYKDAGKGDDMSDLQGALASSDVGTAVDFAINQLSEGPLDIAQVDVADTQLDSLGA